MRNIYQGNDRDTTVDICIEFEPVWWAVESGEEKTLKKAKMVEVMWWAKRHGWFYDKDRRWWKSDVANFPPPRMLELMSEADFRFSLVEKGFNCRPAQMEIPELLNRWRDIRDEQNNGQSQMTIWNGMGFQHEFCDFMGKAYLQAVREMEDKGVVLASVTEANQTAHAAVPIKNPNYIRPVEDKTDQPSISHRLLVALKLRHKPQPYFGKNFKG